MPLLIKAKRIAVGLFQCSLAEDGTMFVLLYFCTLHHRLQGAFGILMQKFVLKIFFKKRSLCVLLKQSICSCTVVFSIFGCEICVCALKRLEFLLRNLQLRFKLKNFGCRICACALTLTNFGCGICACASTLNKFGCGICACALNQKDFGCGIYAYALQCVF